ncbi:MAG TPA: peptidylprolyl isomerase [Steroidobacteraceae bacterium]|nr:peptidylprolyl isomerase [Steroidobacteraceae bacterium]
MKTLLRDPLLHFLLLGIGLFVLYRLVAGEDVGPKEIVVSARTVEGLADNWRRTWQRPPTQDELDSLVEDYVREEVLYREALATGLDRDDTIVRRRLRQKMEFVSDDLAAQIEPTDAELQQYLDQHPDAFRRPARVSFEHLYFSRDRRGERVAADAAAALAQLQSSATKPRTATLGDSIALASGYDAIAVDELDRLFGDGFAAQLIELPQGRWAGPSESGYGLHLVRVTAITPGALPLLVDIRDQVARELLAERRRQMSDQFYRNLREGYSVTVEHAPTVQVLQADGDRK